MSDKITKTTPLSPAPNDPLDSLVQKAVEAGSVDVLERLLAMKQQVHADQARAAFYASLIGFQNECPVIGKTAQANIRPGFSYNYTPLEDIAHAIRPLLDQFQLGYRWFTSQDKQSLTVTCRISHAFGHIEETSLTVPVGADPQRPAWPVAQSLTYAKRYTLCNALGIVVGGEDDDAHEARPDAMQQTGDRTPPAPAPKVPTDASASAPTSGPVISEAQAKRLYAIAKSVNRTDDDIKQCLKMWGYDHTRDVKKADYEAICKSLESVQAREPGDEEIPF